MKKYRRLKNTPYIKTPLLAWFLDSPIIYIGILIAFVFFSITFISSAIDRVNAIRNPHIETPWLEIGAEEPAAINWLNNFSPDDPKESSGIVSANITGCSSIAGLEAPSNLIGARIYKTATSTITAQAYGAGQAIAQFNTYKNLLEKCHILEPIETENYRGYTWENGFIITSGDAIVALEGPPSLHESLGALITETLKSSGCKQLYVSNSDSGRSFFYNRENYTGFLKKETVVSQIDTSNLSYPTNASLIEREWTGEINEPEAPLPDNFPKMPKEKTRPSVPAFENKNEITKTIEIEQEDLAGPGCGWAWSGQMTPLFDNEKLEINAKNAINTAQNEVNKKGAEYLSSYTKWVKEMLGLFSEINEWNQYAIKSDEVKETWWNFSVRREEFKPTWLAYIQQIENYNNFDENFKKAEEEYNKAVEECNKANEELKKWEEENTPIVAPNPEDPDTPVIEPNLDEKPAGCPVPPETPLILTTPKPEAPIKPEIPEGLTIPNSWPQPPAIIETPQSN